LNRAILAGSVIVGFAVMLSMSVIPAQADPPENVCIQHNRGPSELFWRCAQALEIPQHVAVGSKLFNSSPDCHYLVVGEFNGVWELVLDHGPENKECSSFVVVVDPFIGKP